MEASIPYIGHQGATLFVTEVILPVINHELTHIGRTIIPLNMDNVNRLKNICAWDIFLKFEVISETLIKSFLPSVLLSLEEWLMCSNKPELSEVEEWHGVFCGILRQEYLSVICIETYMANIRGMVVEYQRGTGK